MTAPEPRSPEHRIAAAFNARFVQFEISIRPKDVVLGARRMIGERGWHIRLRVDPDDAGLPSLEYYATHRMTSDEHVRIRADGHVENLDAIWEAYGYDATVPGSEQAARERYIEHNREVADRLRERSLYPDGDINAFLRTGGLDADQGSAGSD